MDPMLAQVLTKFASRLNRKGILWGLGGSGLLHVYGLEAEPRDLDLLIRTEHMEAAVSELHPLGVLAELQPKPPFCSRRFVQIQTGGVEADLIAGFRIHHEAGLYELPLEAHSIAGTARIGGEAVPLTAPEDWYVLYLLMGRPKRADVWERFLLGGGSRHRRLLEEALDRCLPDDVRSRVETVLAHLPKV